jgi:hypothetical protein
LSLPALRSLQDENWHDQKPVKFRRIFIKILILNTTSKPHMEKGVFFSNQRAWLTFSQKSEGNVIEIKLSKFKKGKENVSSN